MNRLLLFCAAVLALAVGPGRADTLTFDQLPYGEYGGASYLETGGYRFTASQTMYLWTAASPNASNGTNMLIWGWQNDLLTIERQDGATFDLQGMDLGLSFFADTSPAGLQLSAQYPQGNSDHISLSLTNSFQNYALDLKGLQRLTLSSASAGIATYTALDNLQVALSAPVPEPREYGMLLLGLGLIGVLTRRRRAIALPCG